MESPSESLVQNKNQGGGYHGDRADDQDARNRGGHQAAAATNRTQQAAGADDEQEEGRWQQRALQAEALVVSLTIDVRYETYFQ